MEYPTVCTLLADSRASETLETAIACARQLNSHLDVLCIAPPMMDTTAFLPPLGSGMIADTLEQCRAQVQETENMARARLRREDFAWSCESLMAGPEGLTRTVAGASRFSDLAILTRPAADDVDAETLFDAILFSTALPILLCDVAAEPAFERITIAWDGSDQALAAARAALPLLHKARVVTVLMVDPPQSPKGRFAPGECLATFLSRHGVECDIDLLPRLRARISDVLKQHVNDTQADLLVMGAYGHSKLREKLLGGVTRDLIQSSDVPLFLTR